MHRFTAKRLPKYQGTRHRLGRPTALVGMSATGDECGRLLEATVTTGGGPAEGNGGKPHQRGLLVRTYRRGWRRGLCRPLVERSAIGVAWADERP